MSTSNLVKQEVEKNIKNCSIKRQSVRRFFKYMESQQKDYQILEFAGNGAFALVLKALNKKTGQTVALKVVECDESDYKGMEIVEQEYKTLSVFSGCKYIVKVLNCFYLTEGDDGDDNQILDGQNGYKSEQLKVFFIIEQELCQTNLEAFFTYCRHQNSYPNKEMKETMMIQILDSLAFLHRFNVVHRDIKPSNFLLNFDQAGKPTKGTQAYTAPEIYDKIYKKLSDVFSVGIVLLELDNIETFDSSKTKPEQIFEIKQGNIFKSSNLDRQSQIFKIAEQCILYEVNQRKNAIELLIQFITQNQQYLNVEIFSVINKKDQHMKSLIGKYNQLKSKPFEAKQYEIILNKLQKITRFDPNFEFISVGATGLVLGVFNKVQNRHSVLKIQTVQKHEVIREVGIMRDCQMPLVIKLYDYFYLDVNVKDDFVVYEIEKCHGNLKQYLQNLQKENKQLDETQKIKIAIQIIDVINYLHFNEIVHRDIKLENFLYIEQDSDIPIIKLADFDQARKVPYCWVNYEKQYYSIEGACGTIGYSSPELMKDYLYTFKSDIFSVGVCLALIDNFETLEPVLFQKAFDYFSNFSIPFQINSSVQYEVIKRNTQIYDILLKTVVFNQHKRSTLSLILGDIQNKGYKCYSKIVEQSQEVWFDIGLKHGTYIHSACKNLVI
ncbi:hypothetical protein ABPG72_015977 [Tetrahymena utriculariae]